MKVSFIGLGIMGAPMARHLHQAGYLYRVYNRTTSKTKPFEALGVAAAQTPQEAAVDADVIITMVSDSPDVEEVVLGEQGVIRGAKSGAIVVDMSSINPEVSKNIGAKLAEKGVEFLDAPVSGGEKGAIDGTLAIMLGGKEDVFQKVRPVLETMGSSIVHVGPLGAGGYAKLANQIIVGMNIQAMSEAFYLAKRAGLDFEKLYAAIRHGLAGSKVLDMKIDNLKKEQFQPGFKVALHLKDLNNALYAAQSQGISLSLTEEVQQMMQDMTEKGMGDLDHSALYRYISAKGGND